MVTKDKISIILAQVDLYWEDPVRNMDRLSELIEGSRESSDIIVLPETFTTGFSMKAHSLAESMDGPSVNWMKRIAQKTASAISGSLIIKENNHFFNRFIFATPDGEIIHYDKRHLFSIGGEKKSFSPGSQRVIINYRGWRIGLYICYDIRFPVWCRNRNDTDLMLFTANWPMPRNIAWNALLKARAVENQVYVAGVNRVGSDGSRIKYIGESQLINPIGNIILNPILNKESLMRGEIVLSELNELRKKFPVAADADLFEIL
jgi:predicted amidohydrolase